MIGGLPALLGWPRGFQETSKLGAQVSGVIRTTIDLPDVLVKAARQRALHEDRTLRELVADYIRQGLNEQADLEAAAGRQATAVLIDADGMPLFPRRVGDSSPPADHGALLALERAALLDDDLHRAGLRI